VQYFQVEVWSERIEIAIVVENRKRRSMQKVAIQQSTLCERPPFGAKLTIIHSILDRVLVADQRVNVEIGQMPLQ
jgi:hypothetical protein